jgi:prepilin-type N-terminal cleavage/methylation domain-containing protein
MKDRQRGFNLIELVVSLSVLMSLLMMGAPTLLRMSGDLRVHLAAQEVVGILRLARAYAVRHGANVAVKFRTDAKTREVTFTVYRDGDGDGVLNRDIGSGVDPEVAPPGRLTHLGRGIGFGFPPGIVPRDPSSGRPMQGLDDPIRFNESDLASFGPLGTSTPGSLYLTDGVRRLTAVRVFNRVGRMRVLTYEAEKRVWRD